MIYFLSQVSRYEEEKDEELITIDQEEQNSQGYDSLRGKMDSQISSNQGKVNNKQKHKAENNIIEEICAFGYY